MKWPVLIEPVDNNGFRAKSGAPLGLTAERATPEEALRKLQELLAAWVAAGGRVVQIDLPEADHPWLRGAGMFKDDPLFDEWQQAIAEYRKQIEENPV
ncbi:MAG: hypothetical protein HYS12_26700 [Planctomycetes bacterium]|nr:hypothetical protein [Planctomycetota bacterium]